MLPPSAKVPLPSLVSLPVVVISSAMVTLPAPPTVRLVAPLMVLPDSVSVPASELMRESLARVIAPDTVLALARWRSPPPLAMPEPLSVIGSLMVRPLPST